MTNKTHVVWQQSLVSREEKETLLGQRALTIWLTGLSASGKSTLAFALDHELHRLGYASFVLDGDNVRHGLNKTLGFSDVDRAENIRRVAEVARLMNEAGLIVITAFISPFQDDRNKAIEIIGRTNFKEVHVNTPLFACEMRDPKGLYKKARSGQLTKFTGISDQYEPPTDPDLTLDTSLISLEECVSKLVRLTLND